MECNFSGSKRYKVCLLNIGPYVEILTQSFGSDLIFNEK